MQFTPVPESKAFIEDLLNLFRWGLEEPIHFYPDTSHEYAEHKRNTSGSDQSALARAGLKWQGGDSPKKHSPVESDDPYYDLCFRRLDPLDDAFKKIALKVFEPILAHSKEIVL